MEINLLDKRKDKLFFYCPYNFIRSIDSGKHIDYVFRKINKFGDTNDQFISRISIHNQEFIFYFSFLPWDSKCISIDTYKLHFVLYAKNDLIPLNKAIEIFLKSISSKSYYLIFDIPSEDIFLIQALGLSGFKLIETRLSYFNEHLDQFNEPRFEVRKAISADVERLMNTAKAMRNIYDRFHSEANPVIKNADELLSSYIENSIDGYADIVLVPNEINIPPDSFLTARYLKEDWRFFDKNISQMVLSAVSSDTNRGWYKKLVSEMTYYLRDEIGSEVIFMNTQSTNRAVFKTWESLNYNLAYTTHILSYYKSI